MDLTILIKVVSCYWLGGLVLFKILLVLIVNKFPFCGPCGVNLLIVNFSCYFVLFVNSSCDATAACSTEPG